MKTPNNQFKVNTRYLELLQLLDLPVQGPYTSDLFLSMWEKADTAFSGGLKHPEMFYLLEDLETAVDIPLEEPAWVAGPFGLLVIPDEPMVAKNTPYRHLNLGDKVRGVTRRIKLHDVYKGYVDRHMHRGSQPRFKNPEMVWAGTGSYWCYLDANQWVAHMPKARREEAFAASRQILLST